jgi:DNA-directed RNA polymerase specialized sigma24 family protein
MTKSAPSRPSEAASKADWRAALRGDHAAFQRTVAPHLEELLEAARREIRYRVALGDLSTDDLAAEELVGETLARAWRDRHRRPASLAQRAWLLALLFRVAENIARRVARFRKLAAVSLEAPGPSEPIYDDDEAFWEWYQPDELTRWEDVVGEDSLSPEELATADEHIDLFPLRARQVFVMHDIHRLPLPDVAQALCLSVAQGSRFLADARRRIRAATGREES